MTENAVVTISANPDTPEAIEFFRQLGICITAWAFIDRCLFQIFHHVTGHEQKQSALQFYGQNAFNSRVRLVDDAIKAMWPRDQYSIEWRPLYNQVLDLSQTRNVFAHHPALRLDTEKDGKPFDIWSIYIEPYAKVLNKDYPGLRGKDQLFVEDLRQHDTDVTDLHSRLRNFAWRMGGWRAAQGAALKTFSAK
jgi:hypothetical protein